MRGWKIKAAPFQFQSVLQCLIKKQINEHATAVIEGYIEEDREEAYISLGQSHTWVTISAEALDGGSEDLFSGIITDLNIKVQGGLYKMKVSLMSGTFLMDHVEHTYTYQNADMQYQELLKKITNQYEQGHFIMNFGNGKTLNDLVVQYQETDWKFIKRMASHFQACIIPASNLEGVKYYFGLPTAGAVHQLKSTEYSMHKDIKEYINKTANRVSGLSEENSMFYVVKSREILQICDKIQFKGKTLYVYQVESYFKGEELVHSYILKDKAGFLMRHKNNEKMIGASLPANIIDVKGDTVKVCVKADGTQDSGTAKWFPYSTVYSSPDGTGWYCMPENGDEVRVYFPSEKEKHAYVISAVHLEGQNASARSNPDNKSLKSKYGKELLFTENSIKMTNNKGMSIEIVDEEGISITSDKAINIQSEEGINIASLQKDLHIVAPDKIALTQGDTTLTMEDDIKLSGSQVKMI